MAGKRFYMEDYDAAYTLPQVPEDTPEEMLEATRAGAIGGYCVKTVITGTVARAAVYPFWKRRQDVPERPRRERNREEIDAANERRSIQRGQDLIQANFGRGDFWFTGTFMDKWLLLDDAGRIKLVQNFCKRLRRLHRKNGGSPKEFKYIYTLEVDAAEGIRLNAHILIHGSLTMDEVESKWKYGERNQIRLVVPDENGIIGLANYITKPVGKRRRRWGASVGLKQPKVVRAESKTTKSAVRNASGNTVALQKYFEKLYPGWEVTQVASPAYNERSGGVCLYARLKVPAGRKAGEPMLYKAYIPPIEPKPKAGPKNRPPA